MSGCQGASSDAPAGASGALEAIGNVCIQTLWQHPNFGNNNSKLQCTANDVRIAGVQEGSICVEDGDGDPTTCLENEAGEPTCIEGTTVTFTATFEVQLSAQARYDIGLYFDVNGDPEGDGALTGTCELNTIDPTNSNHFLNLDAAPDVCGDIAEIPQHQPQLVTLEVTTECVDNGEGQLLLPNCTSWRQPGANEVCDEATDAYPGSPSKCNCQPDFSIPVSVEAGTAAVTKTATAACITYEVEVENTTTTRTLALTDLDDEFPIGGTPVDITAAPSATNGLCAPVLGAGETACSDLVLPLDLAPGDTTTCKFAMIVGTSESAQSDRVTATLTDDGVALDPAPYGDESILLDFTPSVPNGSVL
ncbi:MAG: hypothetical protein H5U40_07040 [Polyangiaceae bacterium]|nr:hypothetical protein [Polyangiaceae bacterium]